MFINYSAQHFGKEMYVKEIIILAVSMKKFLTFFTVRLKIRPT
jgi:hypothetical protein